MMCMPIPPASNDVSQKPRAVIADRQHELLLMTPAAELDARRAPMLHCVRDRFLRDPIEVRRGVSLSPIGASIRDASHGTPSRCSDCCARWRRASLRRPPLRIGLNPCASSPVSAIARVTSAAALSASPRSGEFAGAELLAQRLEQQLDADQELREAVVQVVTDAGSLAFRARDTSRSSRTRWVMSRTVITTSFSPLFTKRASK